MINTKVLKATHPQAISYALDVLRNSGIVSFPTDTVYGLGALVSDKSGVRRLYGVKGRRHTKAIAVLIHASEKLKEISVDIPEYVETLADAFWPGPLTIIVNKHPSIPDQVSPGPTLGVRVPDHRIALALLKAAGPMAVTSANLSGENNTRTTSEVMEQLDGKVHMILDGGQTPGGVPSTVLDCTSDPPKILRKGPIGIDKIRTIIGSE